MFEELSKTYLELQQARREFVNTFAEYPGIYLVYKNKSVDPSYRYNRPTVVIRTEDARDWYNSQIAAFDLTLKELVDGDPYTYSANSQLLRVPGKAIEDFTKIAIHEATAISSKTETVAAMKKRLRNNLRKAEASFRRTYAEKDKLAIADAQADLKIINNHSDSTLLRKRIPSSTDVSMNIWPTTGKTYKKRIPATLGAAFYVPLEKSFLVASKDEYWRWGINDMEPVKTSRSDSVEKLGQRVLNETQTKPLPVDCEIYLPNSTPAIGGGSRKNPLRDAFDNGEISPLPLRSISPMVAYLEQDVEAYRILHKIT